MIWLTLGIMLFTSALSLLIFKRMSTPPRQLVNCPTPHEVCLAVTATLEKELDILGALTDEEFDQRVEEAVQASLPPPPLPDLVPFDPVRVKAAIDRVRGAAAWKKEEERLAEYQRTMARYRLLGSSAFSRYS